MAKIKLSSVGITNISGKAGGSIYSRNRGGAYVKNFAVPSNPDSSFQQIVRSGFAAVSQSWRNLTEEERNSFTAMAQLYPQKDVFGDSQILSGFGLHQMLNSNLVLNGQDPISVALEPQGTPQITGLTMTATLTAGVLALSGSFVKEEITDASKYVAVLTATPPSSGTRTFKKNEYRHIKTVPVVLAPTNAVDFQPEYTARFYTPVVGNSISVRVQILNVETGELSVPFNGKVIVEAGV